MARTPSPQDPAPHRPDLRRQRVTYGELHERLPASRTRCAPAASAAATGSPTSARTTGVPGDAVRDRHPGGLRPAQHPAGRARARLPARRLGAGAGPRPAHAGPSRAPGNADVRTYVEAGAVRGPARGRADEPSTSRSPPTTSASSCTPRGPPAGPRARCSPTATSPGTPSTSSSTSTSPPTSRPGQRPAVPHGRAEHATCRPAQGRHLRPGRAFDPAATFDLIEQHRMTFMFGVPTMFDLVTRLRGGRTRTCPRCAS